MSLERVLCKPDETLQTVQFVAHGLKDRVEEYLPCLSINISLNGKTIAGILLNDIRPGRDCWLTIYSASKRWATKRVIKYVFMIVFKLINAKRCTVFVSANNRQSLDMCLRLGFKKEGLLRCYRDDGQDCVVLGMLQHECQWIKKI